jgi:putative phosphoesterase
MRVGVVSDTHGKLRDDVIEHFRTVDHILHAGDIGPYSIVEELEKIAPVTAVWGNTDDFEMRFRVPEIGRIELAGRAVVVVHGHQLGSPTPAKLRAAHADADIIVYGHTHNPLVDREGGALVLNPGAAGTARFKLPLTVAILTLGADFAAVEFLPLG